MQAFAIMRALTYLSWQSIVTYAHQKKQHGDAIVCKSFIDIPQFPPQTIKALGGSCAHPAHPHLAMAGRGPAFRAVAAFGYGALLGAQRL